MKFIKLLPLVVLTLVFNNSYAQQSDVYTHNLNTYYKALELYNNNAFEASQTLFNEVKNAFESGSEHKANSAYYAAMSAIKLQQPNGDELMDAFVTNYPTSTKRNSAMLEVANHYFNTAKYSKAAKWYKRVNSTHLTSNQEDDYHFRYGYSLFSSRNYAEAKEHFVQILNSPKYETQAKYYYGYIAYNQDDYTTANVYLSEVESDASFKKDVSYYMADMNFKMGRFQKAIESGVPLLETAKRNEHSEISKIVGESYFNLKQYEEAIPHLTNYKGKRGKWNNTDYYLLGYAYYMQGDYKNAINNFNKIIDGDNAVAQNAYYHLAECYLKLDKKTEALNAFKNAASMDYKPTIKKDAWLNYAKLSYDIGNPYKSVPDVLQEYLELYPNSAEKDEINQLIISAYIISSDFEGAISYLENKKSAQERKLYQQVTYFRGVELFNEYNYDLAIENFNKSLEIPLNKQLTAKALYWKGEANYQLNNFKEALGNFKEYNSNYEAKNTEEFEHINYHLAYTYFKLNEYPSAISKFKDYINSNSSNNERLNDSYLRIADGYFATRNYSNAINYYNKALENNSLEADYAQFQKAISYGLIGNENSKIAELNSFLNTQTKSKYTDDVLYVLGNSYIKKGNNTLALETFDNLLSNYSRSPLAVKAMLKKGLIFYNTNLNNEALSTYKNIVAKYPNTPESRQAVQNARQIYVDMGDVDKYAAWVKNIDFVDVTNADLDNDMYEAAEKQFLQNNHGKAIVAFKKYLDNFEKGIHQTQANYYLAESLFSENRKTESIPYYQVVISKAQNEFTENALSRLSLVYLENNNWNSAIPVLKRLETEANKPNNVTFAQSNLMKGYYAQENYNMAVNYAEKVLNNTKIENSVKADAQLIIARSAIQTNDFNKARSAFKKVEQLASGEVKAEALYYAAFFENKDGSYRVSNQIVQNLAANYAPYKYWGAKGLLIMANNYYELQDAFQATYILESVIQNFTEFPEVVAQAKSNLQAIKNEQAKTNESIKN